MSIQPVRILVGDVIDGLRSLPDAIVHCCVTSPPYWGLRDYGVDGQIGLESSPDAYVSKMVEVFREVRRVLRDDGTLWLNIGDSYNAAGRTGHGTRVGYKQSTNRASNTGADNCRPNVEGLKPKDLCMIPWRVALALQADGWYLRSVIVWAKKSPMPESVTDRPTSSWEPIFLLAKSERYYYDAEAVKEQIADTNSQRATSHYNTSERYGAGNGGNSGLDKLAERMRKGLHGTRNQRNVWHLGPEPYAEAHFATFPTEIPRRAIKAGTSEKGCCPKCGAPWSRVVARQQIKRDRPNDYTKRTGEDGTGNSCANSVAGVESRTIGWEATCGCNAGQPVPCVVLDPFLGSGTTIAVARQLGRHGVGIELNPAYADMARVRIAKAEKPHTYADHREPTEKGLFA